MTSLSHPLCPLTFTRIAAVALFGTLACSQASTPNMTVDPGGNSAEDPKQDWAHPNFTAAVPQGPAPTSLGCSKDNVVTDASDFRAAFGVTPDELAATASGSRQSTLRWTLMDPPEGSRGFTDTATIDVTYLGTARLFPACGNLAELDVQVSFRSETGNVDVLVPGLLTATTTQRARVTATLPLDELPNWTALAEEVARPIPKGFQLSVELTPDSVSGSFEILGPGFEQCPLARLPATSHCEFGEQIIGDTEPFHGIRARDVLDALGPLTARIGLHWDDNDSKTEATLDVVADGDHDCVSGSAPGPYTYNAPVQLHVATTDGRVDITIPARATTMSSDSDWTPIRISTVGPTLVSGDRSKAFEFKLDGRVGVVTFNSSQPTTLSDGNVVDIGGLDVGAVSLKSTAISPEGPLCVVNDFLGITTPMAHGGYIAGSPSP